MQHAHFAFFALGIAFLAIGLGRQRPFLYIGLVFIIIAFLRWRRIQR